MKIFLQTLFILLCGLVATAASAQGVTNLYLAGGSYSAGATPAFAGSGLYARQIGSSGTYAFTMVDALPSTTRPFTVTTSVAFGVAQRVATIDKIPVLIPTTAGISLTGGNPGWSWSTGLGAPFQVKPNWYVMPTVRVLKAVDGYHPIVGVLFGWGN